MNGRHDERRWLTGRRLDNILAGGWLFAFVFLVVFLVTLGS